MQNDAEKEGHGDAESSTADSSQVSADRVPASPPPRVSASVRKWLVRLSRFALAALFLFSAGAKLWILTEFSGMMAQLLSASKINYERWQWPATIALISVEILTAILLLVPRTARLGALISGLMLVGFSAFALYYVYVLHGEALECGCFGKIIGSQLGVTTALRNLVLLIPVLIVLFGARRQAAGASPLPDHEAFTVG